VTFLVYPDIEQRVAALEIPFGESGIDPYGIDRRELARFLSISAALYRSYFRVKCTGIEHIPTRGRAMLVGNHSGGVAYDGAMVVTSCFLEMEPPRLAQAMAEKFIDRTPFFAMWASRCGQFPGLPENAVRLLEDDRLLVVFPEGARGTAKLYKERNSLVDFGTGFMRLAMQTRTPIIPFGFRGGGEAFPTVFNAVKLGKMLGVPYIPVTAYLAPIPLPAQLSVHYGAPLIFEGTGREDDEQIRESVEAVKSVVASLMAKSHE
jgi:1-acyl-sn-glycerol-3-phosphate acyltransferase